ncbi:hypothetical protein [Edaphobacter aggregans]|uniref:hypothetical protein n=1 Tax=Edaphobacter aggregans TaxID=570835 RepID=UPI0005598B75|nr:hypothetical protein [Edaphobacter aggregans]
MPLLDLCWTFLIDPQKQKSRSTITQGVQSRVFQTDSLGRTIYTKEPETGETSYSYAYNSTGLVVTRTKPRANQIDTSFKTHTTYQYDAVNRLISISYDDGTLARSFSYDTSANWNNYTQSNLKGRLSFAFRNTSTSFTETVFSYDAMGRVTSMAECIPSECGNGSLDKHLAYAYDWVGNLKRASDAGSATVSYNYSLAGEVQSITSSLSSATNPSTIISGVQNTQNGPTTYQMGWG